MTSQTTSIAFWNTRQFTVTILKALTRFRLSDFGEGGSRLGVHKASTTPPLSTEVAYQRGGSRLGVNNASTAPPMSVAFACQRSDSRIGVKSTSTTPPFLQNSLA